MSLSTARRRITPLRIFYFLLGVIVLGLLLRKVDFAALEHYLFSIRIEFLLLGGLAYLCKSMLRAWRFLRLNAPAKPRFPAMLRLTLASSLASQLLPLKLGEVAYVYLLKKEFRASITQGVSSLLIIRVLDLLAISLLFIFGALLLRLPPGLNTYFFYVAGFVGLLLVGLLAAFVAIQYFPNLIHSLLRSGRFARFPLVVKLQNALLKIVLELGEYRQQNLPGWLGLALLEWLINFGVYYLLLVGIDLAPTALDTVVAVTFAALASVLPVNSFGNFGTQEAGWASGLVLLGYAQQTAVTSGFATHLLQLGYMLLLGGLGWVSYLLQPGIRAGAAKEVAIETEADPQKVL